jgi:hypothetical protein
MLIGHSTTPGDMLLITLFRRVLERGLRPADFFADSDPLRLGRIHRDRFTRAVGMLTTQLTDVQLSALSDHFAAPPDQVDWRRFVKAVDSPRFVFGALHFAFQRHKGARDCVVQASRGSLGLFLRAITISVRLFLAHTRTQRGDRWPAADASQHGAGTHSRKQV